jgi:hypothetical protein
LHGCSRPSHWARSRMRGTPSSVRQPIKIYNQSTLLQNNAPQTANTGVSPRRKRDLPDPELLRRRSVRFSRRWPPLGSLSSSRNGDCASVRHQSSNIPESRD